MSNNISSIAFVNYINDRVFSTEDDLEKYCQEVLPSLLKIDPSRLIKQHLTTPFDYTLSNRSDLLIFSQNDPDQVIVTIEVKLDKSIKLFNKGSYEESTRQLHKYCQDLNSPYGVLLSDKECRIFEYKYNGSNVNPLSLNYLPPIDEIEKELLKNARLHELSSVTRGIEELKALQRKNNRIQKNDSHRNSNALNGDETKDIQKANFWTKNKAFEVFGISIVAIVLFWVIVMFLKGVNPTNCGLVRGNVSLNKEGIVESKIYFIPGSKLYDTLKLKSVEGDRCFNTEQEALDAGFRKSKAY